MLTAEHGPNGGDEVNVILPGRNYGWPKWSYGRTYEGPRWSETPLAPGIEQPLMLWIPSIAPTGLMVYTGDRFPSWKGNLFVGAMAGQHLVRLVLNGDKIVAEEKLLADRKWRIREVKQGPDGAIYIFAANQLVRLMPR